MAFSVALGSLILPSSHISLINYHKHSLRPLGQLLFGYQFLLNKRYILWKIVGYFLFKVVVMGDSGGPKQCYLIL